MFVRLGHILLILALLGATGGHWVVLQTIAWGNMLVSNLQTESVAGALSKTFDGDHPCKMCKKISAGKKSEKQAEWPTLAKKLEFISERPAIVFRAPQDFRIIPPRFAEPADFSTQPSVPPPRNSVA